MIFKEKCYNSLNNAIAIGASSVSKLKGKQKKLDVDNDGDIDGHDFKHLREKKSKKGKDVFEKAWKIVKEDIVPKQGEGEDWEDYVDRIYQNHKYGHDPLNLQGTTKCPCRQGFHPCDDPNCIKAHTSSPNSKNYHRIVRFIKNTSNSGTPYDDFEFDGKTLKVYYKDNVEEYTLNDLKEAGVL